MNTPLIARSTQPVVEHVKSLLHVLDNANATSEQSESLIVELKALMAALHGGNSSAGTILNVQPMQGPIQALTQQIMTNNQVGAQLFQNHFHAAIAEINYEREMTTRQTLEHALMASLKALKATFELLFDEEQEDDAIEQTAIAQNVKLDQEELQEELEELEQIAKEMQLAYQALQELFDQQVALELELDNYIAENEHTIWDQFKKQAELDTFVDNFFDSLFTQNSSQNDARLFPPSNNASQLGQEPPKPQAAAQPSKEMITKLKSAVRLMINAQRLANNTTKHQPPAPKPAPDNATAQRLVHLLKRQIGLQQHPNSELAIKLAQYKTNKRDITQKLSACACRLATVTSKLSAKSNRHEHNFVGPPCPPK